MKALEDIYSTYFSDVYRYSRSLTMDEHTAGDITEETFFRAMRSFSSFQGDCEIRVWLCRIAKNIWIDEQQKRKRFTDDEDALETVPDEDDSDANADDRQATLKIHRILHKIEEPYKEVFSLRVFGELSFHDIGELFGKNEHWACVTYHRAKEKIQKEMISL
jgi:RNA polymerase sigma-70 factor (ECF subfamily)